MTDDTKVKKIKQKMKKNHIGNDENKKKKKNVINSSTAKPTAISMLQTKKSGRPWTLSVAFPASIVANAQTRELKAYLVGQLARALTIYSVDEVILWEDKSSLKKSKEDETLSEALVFFTRNLQYLETPQYLRKTLFPFHPDLSCCGVQNPLDAPHHVRQYEKSRYREGCASEYKEEGGTYVNIGLREDVWVDGVEIPPKTRVTIKTAKDGTYTAVSPQEPREKNGLYWGYQTRLCTNMKDVFKGPWGDYDLVFGTSERGECLREVKINQFKHALIVLGGLGGLEEALQDGGSELPPSVKPSDVFHHYMNIYPEQTSRTIRTEEAALITFAQLCPMLVAAQIQVQN